MFKADMKQRLTEGDFASFELGGLTFVTTICYDQAGPPDQEQDGFWPSLDPADPGYIGPKSKTTLRRHMARAKEIMRQWEECEWRWVGVEVEAVEYDLDHNASVMASDSLWGIECNYPTFDKRTPYDNAYLLEVANDMLPGVMEEAGVPLLLRKTWEVNHAR